MTGYLMRSAKKQILIIKRNRPRLSEKANAVHPSSRVDIVLGAAI
jgi:hypothetical protein